MDTQQIIDELMAKARQALAELEPATQEQIDGYIRAICAAFKENAIDLSKEVVEETGLGKYEDKIVKNTGSPDGIMYALKGKKSVGIIGEDKENGLLFVAKPKGVICCVAPTTNPNITALFNATYALKGRNVCIISPHPRAIKSTLHTVAIMNEALEKCGAPKNIIQCINPPSIEASQLLMKAADVIVATGGAGMVKSAYSSGHPAFGVGPGNVQSIIDKGFDYKEAAAHIVAGRKFDNGLICAGNQSAIMPEEDAPEIIGYLKENGAYYIEDPADVKKIRDTLFPNGGPISRDVVGQDALKIAKLAGIEVPADTQILLVKVDKIGAEERLCAEKMCPVTVAITYKTFEEAVEIAKTNLLYEGAGHSAVVHTYDDEKVKYVGVTLPVSRLIVNQPGIYAANPALENGLNPTGTLGCGSWGNNSISENLTYEHLINVSRIAYLKDKSKVPTTEEIWAE